MRTFVAIELPVEVRNGIDDTSRRLRDHLRSCELERAVRWSSAAKLHLTLRFLGETSPEQQKQITDGLSTVALAHPRFQLRIAQLGCFPNRGAPRVIWLGIDGQLPCLARLQTDIEQVARQAGYAGESRKYTPHLTIGRVSQGLSNAERRKLGDCLAGLLAEENIGGKAAVFAAAPEPEFGVHSFVFMRSVLKLEGARYTVLDRFLLE